MISVFVVDTISHDGAQFEAVGPDGRIRGTGHLRLSESCDGGCIEGTVEDGPKELRLMHATIEFVGERGTCVLVD